ncbi:hypothetical protein HanRHA438_Chr12g0535751 [Helianthus annuus]|nr:hypothetical protein HanIR_Chr12g0564681 [Helianthus annuus]KAJ0864987.1 hypothetical protein HanRHA438_Chr12g0535751 [Helianthus annuus]
MYAFDSHHLVVFEHLVRFACLDQNLVFLGLGSSWYWRFFGFSMILRGYSPS